MLPINCYLAVAASVHAKHFDLKITVVGNYVLTHQHVTSEELSDTEVALN